MLYLPELKPVEHTQNYSEPSCSCCGNSPTALLCTVGELAKHKHKTGRAEGNTDTAKYSHTYGNGPWYFEDTTTDTEYAGENIPHNNIPPYYTAYLWHRVS